MTVPVQKRDELLGGSTKIWEINKNCSHMTVKCRPADIFLGGFIGRGLSSMNHRADTELNTAFSDFNKTIHIIQITFNNIYFI